MPLGRASGAPPPRPSVTTPHNLNLLRSICFAKTYAKAEIMRSSTRLTLAGQLVDGRCRGASLRVAPTRPPRPPNTTYVAILPHNASKSKRLPEDSGNCAPRVLQARQAIELRFANREKIDAAATQPSRSTKLLPALSLFTRPPAQPGIRQRISQRINRRHCFARVI